MPRERAVSEAKEPHLLSLKVLRLSRPSLAEQQVLAVDTLTSSTPSLLNAARHSHAFPSDSPTNVFALTPLLTLPPTFGSVFIGESFSCCLSLTNDSVADVHSLSILAEMQTPSTALPLAATSADPEVTLLPPQTSTQRIVAYDLKEEGNHVLSVTVTYTVSSTGRSRTFRKLYQFVAQHCIVVRTKTGALDHEAKTAILEAQLENMSENTVALESVEVAGKGAWKARSLLEGDWPLLRSRDVLQVAFLLEGTGEEEEKVPENIGQLMLGWRSACGGQGVLRTGRLQVRAGTEG